MVEVARMYKVDNGSALKAFADVIIGEVLVKGVRIVEGKNGLFASMPTTQAKDGKWYESVSLTNGELKEKLQKAVLEAYTA